MVAAVWSYCNFEDVQYSLKANLPLIYNLQHAALPQLDERTSFFGVFDGHGGKYLLLSIPV